MAHNLYYVKLRCVISLTTTTFVFYPAQTNSQNCTDKRKYAVKANLT